MHLLGSLLYSVSCFHTDNDANGPVKMPDRFWVGRLQLALIPAAQDAPLFFAKDQYLWFSPGEFLEKLGGFASVDVFLRQNLIWCAGLAFLK
jgi:hypothetical protein